MRRTIFHSNQDPKLSLRAAVSAVVGQFKFHECAGCRPELNETLPSNERFRFFVEGADYINTNLLEARALLAAGTTVTPTTKKLLAEAIELGFPLNTKEV